MSRRGSVRKQPNGAWSFVADVAPGGAMRHQVRKRGFATRKEAQTALNELLGDLQAGTFVAPDRTTLDEYLAEWMSALPTSGRSESTMSSYRHNLRLHVLPYIGSVRLQELGPLDLDRLYARLRTTGRRNGGSGALSARTVRYIHTILSAALTDAVKKGLLIRNPAVAASPPSAKAARPPEMAWWRPEELETFLDHVRADPMSALIHLAAMTGMRRGEVVGLCWPDVDLDRRRLLVQRQLTSTDNRLRWDSPKSDRGRRVIDLDAETDGLLRSFRAAGGADRRGTHVTPHVVFGRADGQPLHPETVSATFDKLVRTSGLPRIRFHDLRHTHAAHLIAAGVDPLTISRRLGHASVAFTLDRYGHLGEQAGASAAQAVADLLRRSPPQPPR